MVRSKEKYSHRRAKWHIIRLKTLDRNKNRCNNHDCPAVIDNGTDNGIDNGM
jgi:hypothetical protein